MGNKRKEDMTWPEQADTNQVIKNLELRRRYREEPSSLTGEEAARAKTLIERDERKKAKKGDRVAKKARVAANNKKKSAYENKKYGIGAEKKVKSLGAGAREGSHKARLANPLVCDKCAQKFESALKVAEHMATTCWFAKAGKEGSKIAKTPAEAIAKLLGPKPAKKQEQET
jgi:hypothetical protein